MAATVISVRNVSKRYRLGAVLQHDTLRDHLGHAVLSLKELFRRGGNTTSGKSDIFWALQDVSFDVQPGEVTGLIGRNGAGKSTLLKILSGITDPTQGEAHIRGRVASLLEVGTGFHHELTGRENVFLNGAILGMSKAEIERKFDEIVAFAEVERFIDTPVKHYSSGMYVRLAFAVAAHLEPEILLVDEVLAVGDAAFQRKCLGKMSEFGKSGRTILFVSHNMAAVQTLCSRAIMLEKGVVGMAGPVAQVIPHFLAALGGGSRVQMWASPTSPAENQGVSLHRVAVVPDDDESGDLITMETPTRIEVEFWNFTLDAVLQVTLQLVTEEGIVAFGTGSGSSCGPHPLPAGRVRAICSIPGNLLNRGVYSLNVVIVRDGATVLLREEQVAAFEVHDAPRRPGMWLGKLEGVVRPKLPWSMAWVEPLENMSQPFEKG